MLDASLAARSNSLRACVAITMCGAIAFVAARWRLLFLRAARQAIAVGADHGREEEPDGAAPAAGVAAPGAAGRRPRGPAATDLEDLGSASESARPGRLGLGEVRRRPRAAEPPAPEGGEGEDGPAATARLPGRQRVHVKTFGCPHNQSDGEYMMGQLRDYGYTLVGSLEDCDACVINSCNVKQPAETRALSLVTKAQEAGKRVVLAGCLPSSEKKLAESLGGVSVLDVTQLDRVVEVVEESIKGHTVKLLEKRRDLPSLSLPKVRKDKFAEIITINAGCLGNCTYCKTKFSRGKVVSYPIDEIIGRARQAASEGICQIELASEDMGAYGLDLGTNIVELLLKLSDALPPNVMIRTGMTNPPYILHHIDGIVQALQRPNVHAFMHIPVQSGSDKVLQSMRREYTVTDFSLLADRLKAALPDLFLLTDIICGFPAESEEDWEATMALARKYKFHGIHISQFYARPGTPAAKMKPLKSHVGKDRYKELAEFVTKYNRNANLEGRQETVWFSGTDEEHRQTVGRTKAFAKVVVPRDDALLGRRALVQLNTASRLHVEGQVIGEVL